MVIFVGIRFKTYGTAPFDKAGKTEPKTGVKSEHCIFCQSYVLQEFLAWGAAILPILAIAEQIPNALDLIQVG